MTLAKGRWAELETELMRIDRDINDGNASAAEIQSLAGLLCWSSREGHTLRDDLHTRVVHCCGRPGDVFGDARTSQVNTCR